MSNDQSNLSASTATPPNTPTQTGQVNGDIDQARDTGSNNTPRDQPNSRRIEERQRWAEAMDSQDGAPNGFNVFHTESSEAPVAAAMENMTIRHGSDTVHRQDTHLLTSDVVENESAEAQVNLDNLHSVYISDLLPETLTREMLDMYAPFDHAENEASSATANSQTSPTNPIGRNRQARRPVASPRRVTSEERRFWRDISDSEDDGEINGGARNGSLATPASSFLEAMTAVEREAMGLNAPSLEGR